MIEIGNIGCDLTPRQIVDELDKYIVGQGDAKRSVAIAIRNRWRRQQLNYLNFVIKLFSAILVLQRRGEGIW